MTKINPNNSDMQDALDLLKSNIFSTLNCHKIGRITAYDQDENTVEVELMDRLTNGKTIVERQPLIRVPLIVLSGGDGSVTFPNPIGSTCLVLFNDRDIDNWFEAGTPSVPQSERMHDIMDGIAIIGLFGKSNVLQGYDPDATIIRKGSCKVILKDGLMTLENGGGAIITANGSEVTITATKVNITTPEASFTGIVKIPTLQLGSPPQGMGGGVPSFDITTTGDIKAGTISLKNHTHGGVTTGSSQTGVPS